MPRMPIGAPASKRIITLTTDFGTADGYVGAMKGVILSINPQASIIDITHDIRPQGVLEAAFVLKNFAFYFPEETIHLVVVDPEVGSKRRLLILKEKGVIFLAPDNGLLTLVAGRGQRVVAIDPSLFPQAAPTFHGRDILAPVAGHLSLGRRPEDFGKRVRGMRRLHLPGPRRTRRGLIGEVIYIDRFGNLITNLPARSLKGQPEIEMSGRRIAGIKRSYFEGREGEPMALIGSHGFLEVAVKGDSAERRLGTRVGERIIVRQG